MSDRSTLSQFGHVFQSKIISSLLSDKKFIQTISDILEYEYFDSDANKWICKEIRDYFFEYKTIPTLEVMKVKIDDMENEVLQVSVVDNLKESWRNVKSTDLKFVQEQTLEFCKNQVMKQAIMSSVDLIEVGQYDQIKKLVDNAMKAGSDRDLGHDYIIGIEERLTQSARDTVKTGWDPIDEVMDGGLGAGELGVVVAPAGIGKSWCLQTIGSAAVREGLNVVHYTLELNEAYVGLRYDSVLTGLANQNLKYHVDEVKTAVEKVKGELVVKYFPTKTASVHTLGAHLQKLRTLGKPFDMVSRLW
jgi:replicative DNA helicase